MRLITLALISFVLAMVTPFEQSQDSNQNEELASWVMAEVVKKDYENQKLKAAFLAYNKKGTDYDLFRYSPASPLWKDNWRNDQEQRPPPNDTEIYEIFSQNGLMMEKMIEKNGRKRNNKPKKPEFDVKSLYSDALRRYRFYLQGQQIINGKAYYIIRFEPRFTQDENSNLSDDEIFERAMNRMRGMMYIDAKDFYLWKLEGRTVQGFRKFLVINIHSLYLELEQRDIAGIIITSRIILDSRFSTFGVDSYYRFIREFYNYKDSQNQ